MEQIFQILKDLNILYELQEHKAIFSEEDSKDVVIIIEGYDNCRMESFFATLKKEKLYQLDTMKMTMEEVKTEVWRFVQYYNRTRICTFNEGGYPPVIYREKVAAGELKTAAQNKIQVFQDCHYY